MDHVMRYGIRGKYVYTLKSDYVAESRRRVRGARKMFVRQLWNSECCSLLDIERIYSQVLIDVSYTAANTPK